MSITLMGQAPGPNSSEDLRHALFPHPKNSAGYRLYDIVREAAGGSLFRAEYLRMFTRVNLLTEYPGPVFPMSEARAIAKLCWEDYEDQRLILMGTQLADAWRFEAQPFCEWRFDGAIEYAVVPHTSGLNRWYNEPSNRELVVQFFREQVLPDL